MKKKTKNEEYKSSSGKYVFGEVGQRECDDQIRVGYNMIQLSSTRKPLYESFRMTVIKPLPLEGGVDKSCFVIQDLKYSDVEGAPHLESQSFLSSHFQTFRPNRVVTGESLEKLCDNMRHSLEDDRKHAIRREEVYGLPFPRGL